MEAGDTAVPYFFLSYAHSSPHGQADSAHPDVWLAEFFEDLCDRVASLSDLPVAREAIGFMEREPRAGRQDWPVGLARALATCRVFVPLFSRRYFQSENCGKEWFAFTRRALNSATRGRGTADAIVPALWVPVDARRLPMVARSIRFDHADFGERYAASGFYGIMKLSRYRNAYENAADALARRIVRAATESPVAPEPVTDCASLVSAFGSEIRPLPGDRRLRITIVAPRRDELPVGRDKSRYGDDARGWNPYAPEAVLGLVEHAAGLARILGYYPDVGDLGQHGADLLSSGPPSSPGVLIVDAWAATIDKYARLLRRLDTMNKPWVQVVVPWSSGDQDNEDATARLWAALDFALGRKLAQGRATSSSAVRGVPTLEDFSQLLPAIIMTAVRHYLRHAPAFPPAVSPEVV